MKPVLFALLALPAFAQTAAPKQPPSIDWGMDPADSKPPVPAGLEPWDPIDTKFPGRPLLPDPPTAAPSIFFGAAVSAQPQSSPKPQGSVFLAVSMSQKQRVYNYSQLIFSPAAGGKLQTSVLTGVAPYIRSIGICDLYGQGTGGVATSGGSASGAFAGGGLLSIPIGDKSKGWRAIVSVQVLKTAAGGTEQLIGIGIGIGKAQ